MSKPGEVAHGLGDTLVVRGPDHVDAVGCHPAADGDHRQLPAQCGETAGGASGP